MEQQSWGSVSLVKTTLYNKVTGVRQHNKHLFGVYRLYVSTC